MTKRVQTLLGGVLLLLMSANLGANIYSMFLPQKGSYDGWSGTWDGRGEPRVTSVDPDGPAAALRVGDEVVAINGVTIGEDPRILDYNRGAPPGTRFTMTIRRAGELREVEFQTAPYKWSRRFNPNVIISILFLLTGWIVFLLRPEDNQAWLLALMLGTLTGIMGGGPSNLPSWFNPIVGTAHVFGLLFLPIFVHLFLIFPEPSPLLRRWPRLVIYLYLVWFLVIFPGLGPSRLSNDLKLWLMQFRWYPYFGKIALVTVVAYLAAGLICLAINYGAVSVIARRRLRVVMVGSAAGFFNLFLILIGQVTGLQTGMPVLWSWLGSALFFTLPLIPLSFVYAIIRHKVIPVSLIIQRGMRYLLVSRGSILLLMAGVSVLMFFVMDAFFSYLKPQSGRVVGVISAVIAIVFWNLSRAFHTRVVAPKVDRLFFHQTYDAHQIMAELAESLRTTTSLPQLLELVATKIQSALHAANVTVLLRDEMSGDYRCAYSCVYSFHHRSAMPQPCDSRLPSDSAAVARLAEFGQPIDLDGRDPEFNLQSENGGPSALLSEERKVLRNLKSALLLPIVAKDELLGVVSLGAHLGDLPFSSEDKKLLQFVSGPASFALENSRLIGRMIEDARRRQELEAENEQRAKELEEARQLQLSMLPKHTPQLPHLEIAAYTNPATEVGGDYYDFHLADDGGLTVVVGDATGHGLKAGTVVTATKSLFKHLAPNPDVVEILRQSSLALKQMNLRSLYMALTLVKVKGYCLTFSAAGMPPILVYRASTRTVEELFIKGVPLGSVTDYQYRRRDLELSQGDVVVLMSDGFPERFNGSGEMLDYAKAGEVLVEIADRSPQEIIDRFIEVGEEWADGRPQDDDVTFVVLKAR